MPVDNTYLTGAWFGGFPLKRRRKRESGGGDHVFVPIFPDLAGSLVGGTVNTLLCCYLYCARLSGNCRQSVTQRFQGFWEGMPFG